MTGSKRKKSNTVAATPKAAETEYTADRFLKGFDGMNNKEIKQTIYYVDEGMKFEEAVARVKSERK